MGVPSLAQNLPRFSGSISTNSSRHGLGRDRSPARLKIKIYLIMYHSHLFKDADQMTANYMFLTGSQLDTIQAAKRDILILSEHLQRLEAMTAQEDTTTDPERLERWYFYTVDKYIKMCDSFGAWLYSCGYFGTIAARKDTPKQAILINA